MRTLVVKRLEMHELTVFNHSRFIFVSIENVFVFISVLCIQFYFYIISVLLINIVFIFVSVNDCLIISISTIISVTKISLVDCDEPRRDILDLTNVADTKHLLVLHTD